MPGAGEGCSFAAINFSTMAALLTSGKRIKEHHQSIANILSLALLPLSGFATDIYVPSLPSMASDLHVGSLEVQFSITLFLISYGLSQLFVGSVLDSFGRYRIAQICLLLFSAASLAIAMIHTLPVIYAMRIVQGITIGTVIAGKRAFFVDCFSGDRLKHFLSLFSIIWSTGPIVAPFLGGWLQKAFGWEANFYLLVIVGLVFAVLEYFFSGETLPNPAAFQLRRVIGVYGKMLTYLPFILGIAMLGLAYSMVMVYNMTGPFIIEHHWQYGAVETGYCSLILGFAWMVGGFISKAMVNQPFFKRQWLNVGFQLLFAVVLLSTLTWLENLYCMVLFAFLIHTCAGFTYNNYITFCLTRFPGNAGIASGLAGGLPFVLVSAFTYGIVNVLPAKDEQNLGSCYLIFTLASITVLLLAFRLRTEKADSLQFS